MIKKIWVAYHLHKIVPEIPVRLHVEHDILVRSTGKFLGAATAICLILACKVAIAGWRVTCDQPYFSLELPFRFLSKEKYAWSLVRRRMDLTSMEDVFHPMEISTGISGIF